MASDVTAVESELRRRASWLSPEHTAGDHLRLDMLARESPQRLAARFAVADGPARLDLLEGDPVCRGYIRGGAIARRWAASPACPWIGKSFETVGPNVLVGHNRLRLLGGVRALAFTAAVEPSLHDGRPALILRYDDPRVPGPRWTRRLHDELREVEPGLLAGPVALLRRRGRPLTVCWFAVDMLADRGP
jgi:hypothetical protein